MTRSAQEIKSLVAEQISRIRDPEIKAGLERILVEPTPHFRNWDYGDEGERFPCWTIAMDRSSGTSIAYSDYGFGPRCPWGLVWESQLWFGQDSGWFTTLEACFVESFAAAGLPIWIVARGTASRIEQVLASDLTMDKACEIRDAAQTADKDGAKYHVLVRP